MELKAKSIINQKIIANTAMQQAFRVLQLPLPDLSIWIQAQIEQNPLISYEEPAGTRGTFQEEAISELDFTKKDFSVLENLDNSFISSVFAEEIKENEQEDTKPSLSSFLMQQAREQIPEKEWQLAEEVIGNLDERGFVTDENIPPALLQKLQTFDPPGICARNLRESLLLQLKRQNKEKTLTYQLINLHFSDLLKGRFFILAPLLGLSLKELKKQLKQDFKHLSFNPADLFKETKPSYIIPDVFVTLLPTGWDIQVNTEGLPSLHIAYTSVKMGFAGEEKYFRSHLAKAKWLLHILARREETLKRITKFIISRQSSFFNGEGGKILPLKMQQVAQELSLHESTIARATLDKYLSTPFGIVPFRHFFSKQLSANGAPLSTQAIKEKIKQLVALEDKRNPLSDEKLEKRLKEQKIYCARRTIAKYRKELKILHAAYRRHEVHS